jgi:hypothetical protein
LLVRRIEQSQVAEHELREQLKRLVGTVRELHVPPNDVRDFYLSGVMLKIDLWHVNAPYRTAL